MISHYTTKKKTNIVQGNFIRIYTWYIQNTKGMNPSASDIIFHLHTIVIPHPFKKSSNLLHSQ